MHYLIYYVSLLLRDLINAVFPIDVLRIFFILYYIVQYVGDYEMSVWTVLK